MDNNTGYTPPQYDWLKKPETPSEVPETPQEQPSAPESSPLFILLLAALYFIMGSVTANLLMMLLAYPFGVDFTIVMANADADAPLHIRIYLRFIMIINQLGSFVLPALLVSWRLRGKMALTDLALNKRPTFLMVGGGLFWLLSAMAFVGYSAQVNAQIPLPEWMQAAEDSTGKLLEAIVKHDYTWEIGLNFLVIAVMPGLGEELLFRGVLQQQLGRLSRQPHVAVWSTAFIFSAVHLQFEGFFPRLFLGVILGYAFQWTRNLWTSILLHLSYNGLTLLSIYMLNIKASDINKTEVGPEVAGWMGLVSLAIAIAIGYMYKKANDTAAPPRL